MYKGERKKESHFRKNDPLSKLTKTLRFCEFREIFEVIPLNGERGEKRCIKLLNLISDVLQSNDGKSCPCHLQWCALKILITNSF